MDTAVELGGALCGDALLDVFTSVYGPTCDKTLGEWAQVRFDADGVSGWSPVEAEAGLALWSKSVVHLPR